MQHHVYYSNPFHSKYVMDLNKKVIFLTIPTKLEEDKEEDYDKTGLHGENFSERDLDDS